jgi:hypothetical protein
MATSAIPEFRDEGSGGNAGASRARFRRNAGFAPDVREGGWVGKERQSGKYITFRRAPDSNLESGFCFLVT